MFLKAHATQSLDDSNNWKHRALTPDIRRTEFNGSCQGCSKSFFCPISKRSVCLFIALFALCENAAIDSFRYTGVGTSSGSYQMITRADPGVWPDCSIPQDQKCGTSTYTVSGPLAPFDDEQSTVSRHRNGRMSDLEGLSWTDEHVSIGSLSAAKFGRLDFGDTSYFRSSYIPPGLLLGSDCITSEHGLLEQHGRGASGEWSICQGGSQSYSSGNYSTTTSKPNAEPFKTFVPPGKEVNIMTSAPCSTNQPCLGFSRGVSIEELDTASLMDVQTSYHGWGGSKVFAIEYNMPQSTDSSNNIPAIWALNAVVEVITSENISHAFSEIYSMKGATGSGGDYFVRPYNNPRTLLVTFDMATDSITLQHVSSFDWPNSISASQMSSYTTGTVDRTVAFSTAYYPKSNNPTTVSLTNILQQPTLSHVIGTLLDETGNILTPGGSTALSSSLLLTIGMMSLACAMMM
ncbi:lipoprotein [Planoprotostelium fungivorum]|uniref:Lipoprotein n=1 Tax=Planoprotostelium fungivorum TaxID=1890364 RepID=A0A2P6N6P9_9EUKA|nr:lipoprotein [Planoprotostelium fungivorum]